MDASEIASGWNEPPRLVGRHVLIEPMQRTHVPGLQAALAGDELSRCWYTNVPSVAQVEGWVEAALQAQAQGDAQPFVVTAPGGGVVGSTRFYGMDASVPKLGIGYTWYVPAAQRTAVNTETKLLLLAHAFDALRCSRVAFKTSTFNAASRAAIARLGALQEGVLRNDARHADGSPRDSVVFSIIDSQWPAVKQSLENRLDKGRLDKCGLDQKARIDD